MTPRALLSAVLLTTVAACDVGPTDIPCHQDTDCPTRYLCGTAAFCTLINAAAPGAPTSVVATPGNALATVSWQPPANPGGSAITGYTVTASPGGLVATTTGATLVTMMPLTNGTSYVFVVSATNSAGRGPSSTPSNVVTPAEVPGAPTNVVATGGNGSATVSWTVPAMNGGSPVTGYNIVGNPGGLTTTVMDVTTATVANLTNGDSYIFTVAATNAVGTGPASSPSAVVTPATTPSAPTEVTAFAASLGATVTWTAPASTGGSAIIGYTVTAMPGGQTVTTSGATEATVTGLTAGMAYAFLVYATNAVGNGPDSSESGLVTPLEASSTDGGSGPDGGPLIAGATLLQRPSIQNPESPGTTIEGETVFTLEFSTMNQEGLDGATVTLQYTDATGTMHSMPVPDQGSGAYVVSSENSALTYVRGQVYTVAISYEGIIYQMQVTAPAPIGISFDSTAGTMAGTSTQPVIINYPAGTALTVGRVPSTDTSVAFYDVFTVANGVATAVTTNAPDSLSTFLEFILGGETPFETPTFDISGSYFSSPATSASATYAITLTSVAQGSQVGNSGLGTLFAGSTFLAGVGASGIVSVEDGAAVDCDGFGVADGSNHEVFVETYSFGSALVAEGCSSMLSTESDGNQITTTGGIYDLDYSDGNPMSPLAVVFPSNCADVGLPGFTPPAASQITPPTGAVTIGAAYGSTPSGAIYGVVTGVAPWSTTPEVTVGVMYLQDAPPTGGVPAQRSGVQVYVVKASVSSLAAPPSLGDVVSVTGLKWSPYLGVNEFETTTTTTITKLGTSPLPTPVSLAATALGPDTSPSASGYEGMRVQLTGGPFSVRGSAAAGTCPAGLQFADLGGSTSMGVPQNPYDACSEADSCADETTCLFSTLPASAFVGNLCTANCSSSTDCPAVAAWETSVGITPSCIDGQCYMTCTTVCPDSQACPDATVEELDGGTIAVCLGSNLPAFSNGGLLLQRVGEGSLIIHPNDPTILQAELYQPGQGAVPQSSVTFALTEAPGTITLSGGSTAVDAGPNAITVTTDATGLAQLSVTCVDTGEYALRADSTGATSTAVWKLDCEPQ